MTKTHSWRMPRPAQRHHPRPRRRGSPGRRAGRGSVTMAMGGGPPLHRRPRGAGAAETTSWRWAERLTCPLPRSGWSASWPGGHRGDGGDRGDAQQPFLSIEGSAGHSHCCRRCVLLAASRAGPTLLPRARARAAPAAALRDDGPPRTASPVAPPQRSRNDAKEEGEHGRLTRGRVLGGATALWPGCRAGGRWWQPASGRPRWAAGWLGIRHCPAGE
jgi:hypothetical protein